MLHAVNQIPLVWIPMRDGTKLAAKLWIPELVDKSTENPAGGEKYPAILGENDLYCTIPDDIHTHNKDGHSKIRRGRGLK